MYLQRQTVLLVVFLTPPWSVFSVLPSDPAPSILQFSLSSSCVSSSLTSGTENFPISTTDHPSLSASQNSPSASLGPCLSPGCLSLSSSPNPCYRLSPSDFLNNSPSCCSNPITRSTSVASCLQSSPIPSTRESDGVRSGVGPSFLFRADRGEDYAYLFFLCHIVNSSFSTLELQQRYDTMGASFRSILVSEGYPLALEASIEDLLMTYFIPQNNRFSETERGVKN